MRISEIEELNPGETRTELTPSAKGYSPNDTQLKFLLGSIKKECTDILSVYKSNIGSYLLRGSNKPRTVLGYYGRSFNKRNPLDTPTDIHNLLVNTMKVAGFKAHRGNSIFVQARGDLSPNEIRQYGTVYIIFPVNGFNYSYSKRIRDLYSYMLYNSGAIEFLRKYTTDPKKLKDFYFKDLNFVINKDIESTLHKGKEVMIRGHYYAVDLRLEKIIDAWIKAL